MSIWNKVLIGLIFVASLAFSYLAMRTLKTHQHWRQLAEDHVDGVGQGPAYRPGIQWFEQNGESTREEIAALELNLRKRQAQRDRMWTGCQPQAGAQTAQTGQVTVATDVRGISPQLVLQVFDATPVQDGGRYLGEFKVAEVQEAAGLITIEPSLRMNARELQRLAASAAGDGTWTLYETMPADTHEAFADLTQEELKQLLPAAAVEEYLNDGQGEYVRPLHDYRVLLGGSRLEYVTLTDRKAIAEGDRGLAQTALAKAEGQRQFREREKAQLTAELQALESQRDIVGGLRDRVQREVDDYRTAMSQLIVENMVAANQLGEIQRKAVEDINARTAAMATATP